LHQTKEECF